jgi:folate-binding Fe-S cluster repair protein YgfZ
MAIEARLEWAIHFAKGCYVGQEVIERSVSRGRVNHLLCLLQIDPAGAAVDAAEVAGLQVAGGNPADIVTSVSMGAGGDGEVALALAYLPAAMTEAGSVVELESDGVVIARATVVEWPRPRVLAGRQSPA